ncbi:g4688 [Coccomyxa elongata]
MGFLTSFGTMWNTKGDRRVFLATVPVLTLGVMGSALFPIPLAFESTGIIAALIAMIVVAAATIYTVELLMSQATATGMHDYETLSLAVGGFWYKLFVEICIVILFLGSIIGGIVQCGQIFLSAAQLYSDSIPDWLVYRSGSVLMVFTTIFIFPPCMVELMTQLEYVSIAGFLFVLMLLFTMIVESCKAGLPAIGDGEFSIVGFTDIYTFAATVSTIAFAFYIQPIAMPMLREMPPGKAGYRVLSWSMRLVVGVICFIIYFVMGFFGAARWGLATNGNLLLNGWGPAGYQGILNILLGVYLALTNPPLVYPVAHVFRGWFPGKQWGYGPVRRFIIIFTILAICLGISLAAPGQSSQIVVITGASGVFLSCYLIPIINHLMLYFGRAHCQIAIKQGRGWDPSQDGRMPDASTHTKSAPEGTITESAMDVEKAGGYAKANDGSNSLSHEGVGDPFTYRGRTGAFTASEWAFQIVLPILVVLLGAFFSILAFIATFATPAAAAAPAAAPAPAPV